MNTCLICDDHALIREALRGAVQMGWPDALISEAATFPLAWHLAQQQPDFCMADLVMPGADPVQGIEGILRRAPHTRLLVVTGLQDDALLLQLLHRGVAGFVPKSASGSIIEAAIHLILGGGRYLPPGLADGAASVARPAPWMPTTPLELHNSALMTDRQLEVLRLVSSGKSNKEIAQALDIAPSTVKTHLENILSVLGAANRMEACAKARELRLL